METLYRPVSVVLQTTIEDNGEVEQTSSKHSGNFYSKNKMDVITFQETHENDLSIKNLITIQPDKVSIKRTGDISMHQQFRTKQTTENVYKHPHGNFHMETFTEQLNYQPLNDTNFGEVSIIYKVKLNGQDERTHKLTLSIKEENSQ